MSNVPALDIAGLTVDFDLAHGSRRAVDDVDFRVGVGEIVAVVGESGSGKSVTANAVLSLLPSIGHVRGQVRVAGRDILGLDRSALRAVRGADVAMVFQDPATALNPVETVGWQLAEALRAHRRVRRAEARRRAVELLELVGIDDAERRVDLYPHQLSGGQKQRVAIALALSNEPGVLIADEPTTALDVTVQAEILSLLRDLRSRLGTAVVLITHNMGVVADLADRVVVMRDGRVVETGDVNGLFACPKTDYTRELLAAVPRLDTGTDEPIAETSADPDTVLDFDEVTVEYAGRLGGRSFRAVQGVSLGLARGEVLGLVGESGSGKSTLGRVAIGLLGPHDGRARVLGVDVAAASPAELRALRRRIGVVFQDPAASLDPRLSVADSVAEPLLVHRVARGAAAQKRVLEMLDAVRLPARFVDRRPRELSGGQRQRVGLARALVLGPELLIADEPTSALDVSIQAAVLELFSQLQQELGFACLFISHDLAVVDQIADHVAVLRAGQLVESGTPATVLRNPVDPYTQKLLASVPVPDPAVQSERRALART